MHTISYEAIEKTLEAGVYIRSKNNTTKELTDLIYQTLSAIKKTQPGYKKKLRKTIAGAKPQHIQEFLQTIWAHVDKALAYKKHDVYMHYTDMCKIWLRYSNTQSDEGSKNYHNRKEGLSHLQSKKDSLSPEEYLLLDDALDFLVHAMQAQKKELELIEKVLRFIKQHAKYFIKLAKTTNNNFLLEAVNNIDVYIKDLDRERKKICTYKLD